jgi:hypothetical protein
MSLHPLPVPPVPAETARIAQAAFPKGNPYLLLRDQLGTMYQDRDFIALFPRAGTPAAAPWRLALVTVLQFAEKLDLTRFGGHAEAWGREIPKGSVHVPSSAVSTRISC